MKLSKHATVLESMWKYFLGELIKLQWHVLGTRCSYPVAFITSALEEKTPQAISWHFNSMHKLYGDSHTQPITGVGYWLLLTASKVSHVNGKCSLSTLLYHSFRNAACKNPQNTSEDKPLVEVVLKASEKYTAILSLYTILNLRQMTSKGMGKKSDKQHSIS